MDSAWLCLCGALVMFMHAGFAMLETGSCRVKNASNVFDEELGEARPEVVVALDPASTYSRF